MRILTAAILGLLLTAPAMEAVSAEWVARVKRVIGEAHVQQAGETKRIAVGDRLGADAVIMTKARSGVGLTFKDNTRVSVGPSAKLSLASYAYEPGKPDAEPKLATRLDSGVAAFVSGRVTKRKPGAMTVQTPSALLGVRGTAFMAVTETPLDQ